MRTRPYTDFYARFLGGFALYYKDREIAIGASLQNKSTQMLLMLLQAGTEGVERGRLLALVRPKEGNTEKRSNNLRQHLHILRRMIARSQFPEGDYVVLEEDRYYFSKSHEVETDVRHLDGLVAELEREGLSMKEREDLRLQYCRAYTGEFLPMLGGEEWVVVESAFYQKWYNSCLRSICERLREEKRYETMLELCTTASQLHPYDEWQSIQIEGLMAMDRYKEAVGIYEEATETFYKDLGPTSLDRVMEKYRDKGGKIRYGGDILDKIRRGLEEGEVDSPYHCSYPSFLDTYRIVTRIGERTGTESLLLLCTVPVGARCGPPGEPEGFPDLIGMIGEGDQDRDMARDTDKEGSSENEKGGQCPRESSIERGCSVQDGQESGDESIGCAGELEAERRRYIEKRMLLLKQVLNESLRTGDVYTRYSESQYLALLIGAGTQDGDRIVARLVRRMERVGKGKRIKVQFTVQAAEGPGAERSQDGETRDVRCAYH